MIRNSPDPDFSSCALDSFVFQHYAHRAVVAGSLQGIPALAEVSILKSLKGKCGDQLARVKMSQLKLSPANRTAVARGLEMILFFGFSKWQFAVQVRFVSSPMPSIIVQHKVFSCISWWTQ